jgi:hypothetical protein
MAWVVPANPAHDFFVGEQQTARDVVLAILASCGSPRWTRRMGGMWVAGRIFYRVPATPSIG